jgi:arginine exporter protein ArgO
MSGVPAKVRHPLAAMALFVAGSVCFLLGFLGQKDWFASWMIVASMCWLGCLTFLARWLSITAATSTSPLLRAIERVRSYIADEPASYEKTREQEANRS